MGELSDNTYRRLAAASLLAVALGACAKGGGGASGGLPAAALDSAIGGTIGDPTTCVLIVDPASGRTLYQYGVSFNCGRPLPACDRPGTLTARSAVALAATPDGRGASCPTSPDGSRTVGWAEGRIVGARRPLVYSAVMEGQRALPGHEMAGRLDDVFSNLGL
ncbi:MAG: hypothetical protein ACYC8V_16395 [Caulobacteraceae bacterium]